MANEPQVNTAPAKKETVTPDTMPVAAKPAAPVAAKPAETVTKFPEAAPVAPAKVVATFPQGEPAAPPAPVKVAPAPVKAAPAATPTPAPAAKTTAKRTPVKKKAPVKAKAKVAAPAKAAAAPKPVKAAAPKAARAVKAAKPAKTPRVKTSAPKAPRVFKKPDPVKVVKPVLETVTEPLMEASQMFENQMKKLQQMWMLESIDTGDIHIANAELREVVESTQQAAVEGVRAINKEMEQFIQHSVDENFAAVGKLMGAKSLPELVELQYKMAQDRLQACVEQGEKFKSIANRTAQTAFAPLNDNLSQMVSGLTKFRFF